MAQIRPTGILRSERFWAGVLVAAFAGYMLFACRRGWTVYDEGVWVYGAWRVFDGEMIYRDFWTVYSPGQFYALAGLFGIFGPSIMVERIFSVAVNILLGMCVYLLAKKLAGRWSGVFAMFLAFAWLGAVPSYGSALHPSLLLSLTSCLFVIKHIDCRRWVWLVVAGATTAMAMLFRHDIGFYTFVAESAVIVLFAYRSPANAGLAGDKRILAALRLYGGFAGAVAVLLLPVLLILLLKVGAKELVQDLIVFPAIVFGKFRALPYPSLWPSTTALSSGDQSLWQFCQMVLSRFIFYMPVVFPVVAVQVLVTAWRRERFSARQWRIVLMLLVGVSFFNYARGRTDIFHMTPTNIVAVIVLTAGLFGSWPKVRPWRLFVPQKVTVIMLALLAVLSFGQGFMNDARYVAASWPNEEPVGKELPRGRGIRLRRGQPELLQKVIGYIRQRVPADQKIFVCNLRHDNIFINDIIFYFLAERHCASKYHELHSGVATTLSVQNQIIEDLRKHNVRYIVMMAVSEGVSKEPNKSSESSGVRALDNFIASNYTVAKRFGHYWVLRNKASTDRSQNLR